MPKLQQQLSNGMETPSPQEELVLGTEVPQLGKSRGIWDLGPWSWRSYLCLVTLGSSVHIFIPLTAIKAFLCQALHVSSLSVLHEVNFQITLLTDGSCEPSLSWPEGHMPGQRVRPSSCLT